MSFFTSTCNASLYHCLKGFEMFEVEAVDGPF